LLQASSLIPDNVRKTLTGDQLKTLEAAAEKATKAAAADLDPWFGEAEADDSSFAPFSALESMTGKPAPVPSASGAQDFLEANPYYDQTNIPLNTYKNKEPHTGKIVSVKRMVGPKATGKEGGREGWRVTRSRPSSRRRRNCKRGVEKQSRISEPVRACFSFAGPTRDITHALSVALPSPPPLQARRATSSSTTGAPCPSGRASPTAWCPPGSTPRTASPTTSASTQSPPPATATT